MDELTRLQEEIDILRERIRKMSKNLIALSFCVAGICVIVALNGWGDLMAS